MDATCQVDEKVFKIPGNYKCRNYYGASNLDPSMIDTSNGTGAIAAAASAYPARANRYYQRNQQPVDEDDILLQLAIQQSLSMSSTGGGGGGANEGSNEQSGEEQVTALELLNETRLNARPGDTNSLQDYHRNAASRANDDDLILQRVLAESLALTGNSTDASAVEPTGAIVGLSADDELMRVLEMSRREEEERARRAQQEEEELQKILELSMLEK